MSFDEGWVRENDRFQLLANGYKTVTTEMSKLKKYLSVSDKIYLRANDNIVKKNKLKRAQSNPEIFDGLQRSLEN